MIVIDASVWVSYVIVADVHHVATTIWMERELAGPEDMSAPALILAEVAGAVARQTGRPAFASRSVQELQAMPRFTLVGMDSRLADEAQELAARLRLRSADAFYVAAALSLDAALFSWDEEQVNRGGAVVATGKPSL